MMDQFPYTNFHELNLDWIIQKVKEAYSPDNPPESMVLSVNGQTGDVVLYSSEDVQFPAVEDSVWTIHRRIDGSNSGLLFIKGSKAQRIDGTDKYDIYDTGNPPPYPVSSVNGATGDVILYQNAQIMLPTVIETAWNIFRTADSVATGIQFNKNAPAQRINGIDRFNIYDAGNPPPYPVTSVNGQTGTVNLTFPVTSVNGQTGAVVLAFPVTSVNGQTGDVSIPQLVDNVSADYLHITQNATGDEWAIERGITSGTTTLRMEVNNGHVEAYLDFTDTTDTVVDSFKLLTTQDIPSSSGVVSVNGSAGVVVLTGSDIAVSGDDNTTIATKLSNLQNSKASQESLAYMEPGDTATQNIPSGSYVYWKGNMCKATSAISQYDTLSSSNLTAVSPNALNDLNAGLATLNGKIATQISTVAKANANYTYGNVKFEKTANIVNILIEGFVSLPTQGYSQICAIPAGFAPDETRYYDVLIGTDEAGSNLRTLRFRITSTTLSVYNYSTELSDTNAQPVIMYIR